MGENTPRRRINVKQPRKLKRAEKEMLSKNGLQASKWMYVSETDFYLKVWNKDTHTIKSVNKYPSKAIKRA